MSNLPVPNDLGITIPTGVFQQLKALSDHLDQVITSQEAYDHAIEQIATVHAEVAAFVEETEATIIDLKDELHTVNEAYQELEDAVENWEDSDDERVRDLVSEVEEQRDEYMSDYMYEESYQTAHEDAHENVSLVLRRWADVDWRDVNDLTHALIYGEMTHKFDQTDINVLRKILAYAEGNMKDA